MRGFKVAALFACVALLFIAGCATKWILKKDYESIQNELKEAESMGAKVCAPKEFATAEAHLDFFMDEWREYDYREARDHLLVALENVRKAKELSKNCIEKTPPDTDGDGILDPDDKCPNEPEDKDNWEDADGCPDPDNDGDKIADASDKCPNEPETYNGYQDEDGCPDTKPKKKYKRIVVTEKQIILKQMVHFETGKATITPDSYPILDEVADVLIENPNIRIRVEGHTDSRGSAEYNLRLSQARADAVKQYLVSKGIDPSRIEAIGYGESRPIDTNRTASGRARNRRVEIHIISR